MKQTAVEWLISKLPMVNDNDPYLAHLIEQAKELEKQQIIDAVQWNYKSNMGEVYYKATFKK